jgi:hypothetical protein
MKTLVFKLTWSRVIRSVPSPAQRVLPRAAVSGRGLRKFTRLCDGTGSCFVFASRASLRDICTSG